MISGAFLTPHPPLIIPAVGQGQEQRISATVAACEEVARRIAALKPQTIVLLSPHCTLYADYFHISPGAGAKGDMGRFRAAEVEISVSYDQQLAAEICRLADQAELPAGQEGQRERALDHGTLIPLWFIQREYQDFQLLRIGLSGMGATAHYQLGQLIAAAAETLQRRVVIVASGDLSHKLLKEGPYGFDPAGPQFDRQVCDSLASGDFLPLLEFEPHFCEQAGECGLGSLRIMAGALDGLKVQPQLLSYEGPYGVGYAVAAFAVLGADKSRCFGQQYQQRQRQMLAEKQVKEDIYVQLARLALETYVGSGKRAALPPDLPAELSERQAGAFVSLKKQGQLRGCIGTISATQDNLAQEIMVNAVSAGCRDPRFPPLRPQELPELVYSVDVLGEAEPIDGPEQLDPHKYGVIVSCGGRRGLLLPHLEGVDTVSQQIEIARQKAGISPHEPYQLQRFEVVRHQ